MSFSIDSPVTPQPSSDSWGKLAELITQLIQNKDASDAEAQEAKSQVAQLQNIQQQDLEKVNQLIDLATKATVEEE